MVAEEITTQEPLVDDVREFPMPVNAFVKTLATTHEEVWTRLLVVGHRGENHTPSEWRLILDEAKGVKSPRSEFIAKS